MNLAHAIPNQSFLISMSMQSFKKIGQKLLKLKSWNKRWRMDGQTDERTQGHSIFKIFRGYKIIPRHFLWQGIIKWHVRPAKSQISLGICPVWAESSLSAWRKFWSLATHWAHSEDSDQTGLMPRLMPRLIRDFAGNIVIFLVLSWGGSNE